MAPTVSRFAATPQRDTRWALPSRKQKDYREQGKTRKETRRRRQAPQ